MSTTKNLPIDKDIYAQQAKIIESQRAHIHNLEETNLKQAQRIEYLQEEVREYRDLKAAFGGNGNLTYYQAMAVVQTRQNAAIERDRNFINAQKQADLEALRQAAHDKEVKEALENNPHFVNDCNERKAKINAAKDKMLELAERFYLLSEKEATQYANLKHSPNESAVKHLITEITIGGDIAGGPPATIVFQCDYCKGKEYPYLSGVERHIWNEGQDHHDINISRIEEEAREDIAAVNKDLQMYIDNVLQGKRNAEHRAFLQHEREEEAKAKQNLPYAK